MYVHEPIDILECSLLDLSSPDTLLEIVSGWIQEDLQIFHCTGTENHSMKYQAWTKGMVAKSCGVCVWVCAFP